MDYSTLIQTLEEKLDLKNVSKELKEDVLIHIGDTIIERTMLVIASSLSEEEATQAMKQLKEGDIEAFMNMLKKNHPELDDTVVSMSTEVINEFIKASTAE